MDEISTAAKLDRTSEKLSVIAGKLYQMRERSLDGDGLFEILLIEYDGLAALVKMTRKLSRDAARMALANRRITRMKPKHTGRRNKRPAEQQSFHHFQYLPAEIRLLIWEAAARPPPCAHFFATYKIPKCGTRRHPAAHLMDDGGLWNACKESRKVIHRAYCKQRTRIAETGCRAASKSLELHYKRISKYNQDSLLFNSKISMLGAQFWDHFYKPKPGLSSILCDLYDNPGPAFEKDGRRILVRQRFCKELQWDYIFT